MFEFGRDLRRRRPTAGVSSLFKGVTSGGDRSLYELLDLSLLTAEGKTAEAEAGRMTSANPAATALRAAGIWRELARRAGDPVALRKAAALAETAANLATGVALGQARCEQAQCALLGAELFGDESLTAAASHLLGLAPGSALATAARGRHDLRLTHVEQACVKADLLIGSGAHLKDRGLIDAALRELAALRATLDPAYEPLTTARLEALRGGALVLAGETSGDVALILDGVDLLTEAVEMLPPDHSPLDWARVHAALALALQALGEATSGERAFEQAVTAFDRARTVLADHPALQLTALVANNRAVCLARCAELTGDLAVLDAAEAALKTELINSKPQKQPVAWAIIQVNLARLYEARAEITGKDNGGLAKAAVALAAAFDVFTEEGLRSLSDMTQTSLERLKAGASA